MTVKLVIDDSMHLEVAFKHHNCYDTREEILSQKKKKNKLDLLDRGGQLGLFMTCGLQLSIPEFALGCML